MRNMTAVKRITAFIVFVTMLMLTVNIQTKAATSNIKLGDDLLLTKYQQWIQGKRLGLITNQTGVNSQGESMVQLLSQYKEASLKALYAPEHGLDGKAKAGAYVESYTHPELKIPVYSLYGKTRMPTEAMLKDVDVLLFDIQDIGARSYTYISTLQYCMSAARKYNKEIIVLDRPNPLGGVTVEGPVLKDGYQSFVGVDNLPMAHGMTVGELAQFFNRKIGANLRVVPMEGYTRRMIYQDTGLQWVQSSPMIPHLQAVWGYMATGLGEGTGIYQADTFQWVGGKGIDADKFANLLNQAKLPGVTFLPEKRGQDGGVRLRIDNPHSFNPAKTGIYVLAYAHQLNHFPIPKTNGKPLSMFDKIMGTNEIGQYLEKGYSPQQIESMYAKDLEHFKNARAPYLIYENAYDQAGGENKARVSLQGAVRQGQDLYVPLKPLLAELGFDVRWDETAKQLVAVKSGKKIVVEAEAKPMILTVNGRYISTGSSQPLTINHTAFVPLALLPSIDDVKETALQGAARIESQDRVLTFLPAINQSNLLVDSTTAVEPQVKPASEPVPPAAPAAMPQPRKDAETPKAAATVQSKEKPAPLAANSSEKVAYLTFDDGPSRVTPKVLDILKANKIHATFFVVGKNIKGNEAILKREVAEGHVIGGHTFSHNYKTIYHDKNAFMNDLEAGIQAIEKVIGGKTTLIRFPGGSNNTVSKKAQDPRIYSKDKWIMYDLVEAVKEKGYQYFDWNVSSGDASSISYTAEEAIASVKATSKHKHELIILLHDAAGKENTAKALPEIIRYLKAEGFTFKVLEPSMQPMSLLKVKPKESKQQAAKP